MISSVPNIVRTPPYLLFEGDQFLWLGSRCRSEVICFCIGAASFPRSAKEGNRLVKAQRHRDQTHRATVLLLRVSSAEGELLHSPELACLNKQH